MAVAYGASVEFIPPPEGDAIAGLLAGLSAGAHRKPVGVAAVRAMKDHLVMCERTDQHRSASALGAKPTGLYGAFARSTSYVEAADGVEVAINHVAASQRIEGGEIRPVNGQFLIIPAIAAAYGKRAATVGVPLRFGYAPDPERNNRWRKALIADEPGTKSVKDRRKGREGQRREVVDRKKPAGVYFWLVRKAVQEGDPTLVPTADSMFAAVFDALDGWIQEQTK